MNEQVCIKFIHEKEDNREFFVERYQKWISALYEALEDDSLVCLFAMFWAMLTATRLMNCIKFCKASVLIKSLNFYLWCLVELSENAVKKLRFMLPNFLAKAIHIWIKKLNLPKRGIILKSRLSAVAGKKLSS